MIRCLHGADRDTCARCPRPLSKEDVVGDRAPRRAAPAHAPTVVAVVPTVRVVDQPPPAPERAELPAVWELVIADIERKTPPPAPLRSEPHALYGALLAVVEALAQLVGSTDIVADMRERDALGRVRYGTPLQPHNGRNPRVDAYQEALELLVYYRQHLYETEGR